MVWYRLILSPFAMSTSSTVWWYAYLMWYTVYPMKYAHGLCFAVLCCGYTLTDFPISIRLTSLALWQSNDCPSARKATLMNMDKYFIWIHYERLHNHNKAKHNKTVCIFLGIYCIVIQIPYLPKWIPWNRFFAIDIEKLETELHYMEFHETLGFSILMSWAASLNSKVYNGIGSGPVSMRWATYGASRIWCTYIVLIESWCPGTKCVKELNYLTMIKYRNRHRNGIQTEPKSPKFSFACTPFVYLVFLSGKQQIVRYAKSHRPDLLPSSMCRYALPCA